MSDELIKDPIVTIPLNQEIQLENTGQTIKNPNIIGGEIKGVVNGKQGTIKNHDQMS